MGVEPVPDSPAAVVDTGEEVVLTIADYHAGIEGALQSDGVELDSRAADRRERLAALVDETAPDRLVILGDLVHAIGDPWERERQEVEELFDSIDVPVTLVKGNHDGVIEPVLEAIDHDIEVTPSDGTRIGKVGFAHGHTWPSADVVSAEYVCIGHEHPVARLEDSVGGSRLERVWLRGEMDPTVFEERPEAAAVTGELVVFPAFNDLSGGTWINVAGQDFLAPFLPDGLARGDAYLLDGTRLGEYRSV
jgi:putative SbcD/Mre11-related phosphoesterase